MNSQTLRLSPPLRWPDGLFAAALIAGAVLAWLRFGDFMDGFEAIRDERLWVGDLKHSLWDLSHGEPLETQLLRSNKPKNKLECLVKEVTLLSERHLTMRTKGKGRFPSLAIIAITKIVQHFPEPDRRTVSPIQKKYAKKDNEEPLATKWINYP